MISRWSSDGCRTRIGSWGAAAGDSARRVRRSEARIVVLVRRRKKRPVARADDGTAASTTGAAGWCAICRAAITRIYLEVEVRRVACRSCGAVKRERLDWLADNPFYTKRFAFFVGRRCRDSHDQGSGRGTAPRLAGGQGAGEAVHARATAPRRALRRRGSSASTRSPSARGTRTASWSATWSGCGRSGSAARTAPKPAWTSSSPGSARRSAGEFSWRSWTCGRRSATPPSATPRRPASCSTSSTS